MKLTITSIELKSPFKFFALSRNAMHILKQLKSTNCTAIKTTGFWTKHYTMTLWPDEESMKAFMKSGAHLAAMKKSGSMAKVIGTLTVDADALPTWKEAKEMLKEQGKMSRFD